MICQKPWPPVGRGLFFVYICIENFKILIVTYPMTDFNITWLECCFGETSIKIVQAVMIRQKTWLPWGGAYFPYISK